jgi:hypothetical protein
MLVSSKKNIDCDSVLSNSIGLVSIDFRIGEISWYPDPGTAVEEEFIDYLIADFLAFEVGDIVVTEYNLNNMSYVMRVHCHPFNC